jgi:cell division transport system ATP-binding protein
MVRLQRVDVAFAGRPEVLVQVSVAILPGEMVFVIGHTGAGKSTFLRLLALMDRPTRGRIFVNGAEIGDLPARRIPEYRRQIGLLLPEHRLIPDWTVAENVAYPLRIAGMGDEEVGKWVRAALERVGMARKEASYPGQLALVEQRRVELARAMVSRPKLLLADEPTGDLDAVQALELMRDLAEVNRGGVTVVVATHDINMVRRLGRRALVLRDGRLIGDGRMEKSS